MKALMPPDPKQWQARADWFWRAHDINAGPQSLEVDARTGWLLAELETVFCAGAWTAAVILAWALVEAAEREAARRAAARGEEPQSAPDVDWLRERRNALIHAAPDASDEIPDEAALEAMAQGAIRVVFKTLFAGAWR